MAKNRETRSASTHSVHAVDARPGDRAALHHARRAPLRRDRVGAARRADRRSGQAGLRAARRRVPEELVPERDQHRRPEVLPRPARLARSASTPSSRWSAAWPARSRLGPRGQLLRDRRRRRRLRGRAEPHPGQPAGRLQLAGLVQRRVRGEPAVLGLLHPLGRGHDGVDPRLEHQGGNDLPRRLRLGHQPLEDPLAPRSSSRRAASRPGPCRSCAAPTRGPARSSRAARRAARPRWSCSTSTTRTSSDFIWCKAKEEDKAGALAAAGFDMSIDGEGFHSIQYQNANNSVRVTEEFLDAVERGERVADDRARHAASRSTPTTPAS